VTLHTAMSTAFVQPAPGAAPSPGPMNVRYGYFCCIHPHMTGVVNVT
jgi:hypothetical protein